MFAWLFFPMQLGSCNPSCHAGHLNEGKEPRVITAAANYLALGESEIDAAPRVQVRRSSHGSRPATIPVSS